MFGEKPQTKLQDSALICGPIDSPLLVTTYRHYMPYIVQHEEDEVIL